MNRITSLQILLFALLLLSCKEKKESKQAQHGQARVTARKPAAASGDTFTVRGLTAVFYHADSLQLRHLQSGTDSSVFDGMMHEYFYQMRNARQVIRQNQPALLIAEARHCRYLAFIYRNGTRTVIDLNAHDDAYGLFIFNGRKAPQQVDMTNIETALAVYLAE
jgi:hypothetical protein